MSGKGRGYQLEATNDGTPDWIELRKVSIWQTLGALEQEFREKAAHFAQSKKSTEIDVEETNSLKESDEIEGKLTGDASPDFKSIAPSNLRGEEKELSSADCKSTEKPSAGGSNMEMLRPRQALPHHLPKLDRLSNKLDDIRRNMGDSVRSCVPLPTFDHILQ